MTQMQRKPRLNLSVVAVGVGHQTFEYPLDGTTRVVPFPSPSSSRRIVLLPLPPPFFFACPDAPVVCFSWARTLAGPPVSSAAPYRYSNNRRATLVVEPTGVSPGVALTWRPSGA